MSHHHHSHVRLQSSRAPYNRGGFRFHTTQVVAVVLVETLTDAQLDSLQKDAAILVELFTPELDELELIELEAVGVIERVAPIDQAGLLAPASPIEPAVAAAVADAPAGPDGAAPIQPSSTVVAEPAPGLDTLAPAETGVMLGSSEAAVTGTLERTSGVEVGVGVQIPTVDAGTGEVIAPAAYAPEADGGELVGSEPGFAPSEEFAREGVDASFTARAPDVTTTPDIGEATDPGEIEPASELAEAVAEDVALAGGSEEVEAAAGSEGEADDVGGAEAAPAPARKGRGKAAA